MAQQHQQGLYDSRQERLSGLDSPPSREILRHPYIRATGILVALTLLLVAAWSMLATGSELRLASYLTLHTFLETCSIVVCVMVFTVARTTVGDQRNRNMVLLGVAFLGVALLDFLHTQSYFGMPALVTPSSPGKAINFWLAARLLGACALLAAAFLSWEEMVPARQLLRWSVGMLIGVAVVAWVFLYRPHWMPETFVPGQGLTAFKIWAEYVIIVLSLIAAFGFYRVSVRRNTANLSGASFDPVALLAASTVTAMAELFFTIYTDVNGLFNVLGHIYKVIGAWFLYRGLVTTNLFEVETRSRLALESAQLGAWSWDAATDTHQWDERVASFWGLPTGARSTMSEIDSRIHPDDRAAKQEAMRKALEATGDRNYRADYRIVRPDGSIRYVESRGRTQFRDGRPALVVGVIRDVTERRMAEDTLRESEARLSGILSIAADAIISIDEQHKIILFNRGAEATFGYLSEEALGQPLEKLLPERFRTTHGSHIHQFAASGTAARRMGERREIYGLRKDGTEFRAEASISKLEIGGRRTFTVVLRDISERISRERAVQESELRLRRFIEQAPAAIAMFDRDMRYMAVSDRWRAVFSPEARDVIGRSHYEVIPDLPERWKAIHQRGLAGETLSANEDRFQRASGETMWIRWEVRPWHDHSNAIGGIMIFADDETAKVAAEQARRQTEERLGLALTAGQIGLFEHDHRTKTLYWSPIYRQILGVSPDEPASLSKVLELIPPEDREGLIHLADTSRRRDDPGQQTLEHRIVRADGSTRWIARDVQTYFDGEGPARHVVRTVGVVRDITERKQHEAQLEHQVVERTAQLSALVDALPDGIVHADLDRRMRTANAAMTRLFGYARDEFEGMPASNLYASSADNETVSKAWSDWEKGHPIVPVTVDCRRKDGTIFTALVLGNVVRDKAGQITGRVGIIRDITDEVKRQKALTQAQRMEAFGQLTGGIAHDFNNLLTVISGNQELLEMRLKDEKDLALLKRAQEASDMGARLTARLLTFARRRQLEPTLLNLNSQIAAMTELLQRSIGEHVILKTKFAARLGMVRADASEIENAILNLAINARDAMPSGGTILIETAEHAADGGDGGDLALSPGRYVRLSVTDTGTGMPPEVARKAFEPFFTTKQPGKGTGLGLSTIHGFAQQSGGTATIYSEVGRGTTVNIYLPQVDETGQPLEVDQPTDAVPPSGGETVLLVEDNPDVREVARKRLEVLGYKVVEAESGPAAIEQLKANGASFQIVFSDVVMPGGMSGYDLGQWATKNAPSVKVLLTSGYPGEMAGAGADALPGVKLLRKPYTGAELARAIRQALDA